MAEQDYTGAGEKAAAAGMEIIDPTTYKVKYGGDEINKTRDMIADRSKVVTELPATGEPGQIYFRIGGY